MKKYILFIILTLILLSGCRQERTSEDRNKCSPGYVWDEVDCCFDEDNDGKCDLNPHEKIEKANQEEEKYNINDEREYNFLHEASEIVERKGKSVRGEGYAELLDVEDGVAVWLSVGKVFQVLDISNSTNIVVHRNMDVDGSAEVVTSDDKYVYYSDSKKISVYSKDDPYGEIIGTYEDEFRATIITVEEDYAYISGGSNLVVLDISNPKKIKRISESEIQGSGPSKIFYKDGYLFFAVTLGGLNVINVKDPYNPKEEYFHPFETHEMGFEMSGDYLYLARMNTMKSSKTSDIGYESTSKFEVFDISNPVSLKIIGSLVIPTKINSMAIKGNYVYVAGDVPNFISVIDISNPSSPKIANTITSIEGARMAMDMYIYGDYAYFMNSGDGFQIFSLKDPINPSHVKDYDAKKNYISLHGSGDKMYMAVEERYFNVADVKDPENPVLAYTELIQGGAFRYTTIELHEGKSFSNANGLVVHDVKDPYKPKKLNIGNIDVDGIHLKDNYLYTVIGEWGLDIYDMTDLNDFKHISRTEFMQGMCSNFILDDHWVVCKTNIPYSINVIDVTDPKKPIATDTYEYKQNVRSLTLKDNILYVSMSDNFLDIFRIKDNGKLELISTFKVKAGHVQIKDDKAYVLSTINILDVSDLSNPVTIGEVYSNNVAEQGKIYKEYLYVADGNAGLTVIPLDNE
ncbi:hypothetical protein GOV09_07290 [Candidatus Woesearchaeota archaeon]|nr:hypothetical protein [Candidatus Woesearchaeota archaeon]